MKKIVLIAVLGVLAVLIICGCSPKFSEFVFVQMTDPQIGFRDKTEGFVISDSLFDKAAAEVNALKPKLVVITGDLIDDQTINLQDSIYRANRAKIKAPVYEIPGNHDIRPWTPDNYFKYFINRGYARFCVLRYGCAFIGIDSNCIIDAAKEKSSEEKSSDLSLSKYRNKDYSGKFAVDFPSLEIKDGYEGWPVVLEEIKPKFEKLTAAQVEARQLDWLKEKLREARRYWSRYIFVFLHCPIIRESIDEPEDYFNFPKGKREKYIALFKKYGVDVVFAGHTHMDYDTMAEGIRFVTAGPVGRSLGRGYSGYEIVRVSKDSVNCRFVPTR